MYVSHYSTRSGQCEGLESNTYEKDIGIGTRFFRSSPWHHGNVILDVLFQSSVLPIPQGLSVILAEAHKRDL